MMTLLYADVSHHDWSRRGGQLDWAAVRAATSPVMCARATYGDPSGYHPETRHFADFQRGAKAAGFTIRGAYHNLIAGDAASMRRQVDWFRRTMAAEGCHWAMVDVERYPELVSNGLWPRWSDVLRWRDAWYAVEQRPIVWYLPQWLFNGYYGGSGDMTDLPGPLVQSHYAGGDGTAQQIYAAAGGDSGTGWDDTYGGRRCDIWQYTSAANVAGASGNTDVNAYRGSLDQLTALLTGDDMPLTDADAKALIHRVNTMIDMADENPYGDGLKPEPNRLALAIKALGTVLADVATDVEELKAKPPVQSAPVDAAALKAVLLDPEVVAVYAKAAADLVHADLAD